MCSMHIFAKEERRRKSNKNECKIKTKSQASLKIGDETTSKQDKHVCPSLSGDILT